MTLVEWAYLLLTGYSKRELALTYDRLSHRYRQSPHSFGFESELEVKVYAAARMPATLAVVSKALQQLPPDFHPSSILDLGAGTGSASFAVAQRFASSPFILTLVEQDPYVLQVAKHLMHSIGLKEEKISFLNENLHTYSLSHAYDLVILSYVMNELPPSTQKAILSSLFASKSAYILIVVPGTPSFFSQLLHLRQEALDHHYMVIAPCPHSYSCPMIGMKDWCHFTVRLERSQIHRFSKSASLPFEDEKFSYLLLSKEPISPIGDRIVKKPIPSSGHITFDICKKGGKLQRITLGKKHPDYKKAKKLKWGDVKE